MKKKSLKKLADKKLKNTGAQTRRGLGLDMIEAKRLLTVGCTAREIAYVLGGYHWDNDLSQAERAALKDWCKANRVRLPGPRATEIDWRAAQSFFSALSTIPEVASALGINSHTLERRIKAVWQMEPNEFKKRWSGNGLARLRKAQYELAVENKNATMQIWLGKNWLNQADKIHTEAVHRIGRIEENLDKLNDEELRALQAIKQKLLIDPGGS